MGKKRFLQAALPKKVNFTPLPYFETAKAVNGVQFHGNARNKMQCAVPILSLKLR